MPLAVLLVAVDVVLPVVAVLKFHGPGALVPIPGGGGVGVVAIHEAVLELAL